ncbi:MAG: BCCT family transporter [Hyphomonadaceae bacterium]|nr:BCCT family transporter [Hyphomonadaceae bacterium]
MAETTLSKEARDGSLRLFVIFVPMSIFIAAAAASLINLDGFFAVAKAMNDWILATFSSLISWAVFGFVLTCFAVVISPLGRVTIGGEGAEKTLKPWSWFSITLCTTIAIGILFWAMAEPLYHLYDPGGAARGIEAASPAAKQFSLVSLFMHWAISPYAIYTVAALTFALAYHNLGKPYSVSGPFIALLGRPLPAPVASVLDAAILLALIMGMAASLGAGMLLLSGGVANLTGLESGPVLLALVALAIGIVVLISSLTGLMHGIRILSVTNAWFFFIFVGFIILFGPSFEMLRQGGQAVIGYAGEFLDRSLMIGAASGDGEWAKSWTTFYFANWLAWAPVTAMFLGRIARGYTVRAFVLVNLVLPALFSMLWMSAFGVFAMETDLAQAGLLKETLDATGPESVLFRALEELPVSGLMIPVLLLLSFISYVTAADSNTEAISQICKTHTHAMTEADETEPSAPRLKIAWVILLCLMAWIMVAFSGIDGVRMLSNVGGLPALFVVLGLQACLLRMMFQANRLATLKTASA